jgi:hypothetical protein
VSCYDTNLSPSGCTQYFYGGTTGTLNSFNYANSYQLASQAQHICIRLVLQRTEARSRKAFFRSALFEVKHGLPNLTDLLGQFPSVRSGKFRAI